MHRPYGLKALRLALAPALLVVAADLIWAAWSFTQADYRGAQFVSAANLYLGVALALVATFVTVHRLFRLTLREMGRDGIHPLFDR
jgi:hypothetical protein